MGNVFPDFKDIKTITGVVTTLFICIAIVIAFLLFSLRTADANTIKPLLLILYCFTLLFIIASIVLGIIIFTGKGAEKLLGISGKITKQLELKQKKNEQRIKTLKLKLVRNEDILKKANVQASNIIKIAKAIKELEKELARITEINNLTNQFKMNSRLTYLFVSLITKDNYIKYNKSEALKKWEVSDKKTLPKITSEILELSEKSKIKINALKKNYPNDKEILLLELVYDITIDTYKHIKSLVS